MKRFFAAILAGTTAALAMPMQTSGNTDSLFIMKYNFGGLGTADGYTFVSASDKYSTAKGYGFANTAAVENVPASGKYALSDQMHCAAEFVPCGDHDSADPAHDQRAHAHDAGLQSGIERICVFVRKSGCIEIPDRFGLGVCRRRIRYRPFAGHISAFGDDISVFIGDDRSDRLAALADGHPFQCKDSLPLLRQLCIAHRSTSCHSLFFSL